MVTITLIEREEKDERGRYRSAAVEVHGACASNERHLRKAVDSKAEARWRGWLAEVWVNQLTGRVIFRGMSPKPETSGSVLLSRSHAGLRGALADDANSRRYGLWRAHVNVQL